MRIVIADDHKLVLEGLELLLSTFAFVTDVATAENNHALDQQLAVALPDLLLLDISFGQTDGRLVGAALKKQFPALKIAALTSHEDAATLRSVVQAGFDGYLLKSEDRETIGKALLELAKGERFFSGRLKENLFQKLTVPDLKQPLSNREKEVLQLIADEKTTREIAQSLFISEKTVEHHRASIMLKLDVKNIAGMIRRAIITGLVR